MASGQCASTVPITWFRRSSDEENLRNMKISAQIKLLASESDHIELMSTVKQFNLACNWLAEQCLLAAPSSRFSLHEIHYRNLRNNFGLKSQIAIRCIAKTFDAYDRNKLKRIKFRDTGAIPIDTKMFSVRKDKTISISTNSDRRLISFECDPRILARIYGRVGQGHLVYRNNLWFIYISIEAKECDRENKNQYLGIDLGIMNLSTDSDGVQYSGLGVESKRVKTRKIRSSLQSCGTRSARRHLKKLSGKESRFRRDVNHCISKSIVAKAKGTERGIALEDLSGIRERTTVRKQQRAMFGSWAFYQLRSFIEYKAKLAGVPVQIVDPRNTSRTCPKCDYCDKQNRKSQSEFECKSCGFVAHADVVGATNIARRAAVNRPIVSSEKSGKRAAIVAVTATPPSSDASNENRR